MASPTDIPSTEQCICRRSLSPGLRPQEYPLITLRGYIIFWGCAFTLITLAIALWKQESDHYTEAQERKRQRRRKHKPKHTSNMTSQLEAGTAGQAAGHDDGDAGLDWTHRRAEILTAYARLWEVVSAACSRWHGSVWCCQSPISRHAGKQPTVARQCCTAL